MRSRGVSAWLSKYHMVGRDGTQRPASSLSLCCGYSATASSWSWTQLGSCNAESMVWRQNRCFHAQVQRIPKVLGCQEHPAASIFGFRNTCWLGPVSMCVLFAMQGEEGPPSLEYIQAKDLFPPKELVKEEESLQVRK